MNEGSGLMFKVAMDFQKGVISEKIMKEICEENNWNYKLDNNFGVLVFPNIKK